MQQNPNELLTKHYQTPTSNHAGCSKGRDVVAGGRNSGVQLILLQPGADYAHHITASPPGFENLTTSLLKQPSF